MHTAWLEKQGISITKFGEDLYSNRVYAFVSHKQAYSIC